MTERTPRRRGSRIVAGLLGVLAAGFAIHCLSFQKRPAPARIASSPEEPDWPPTTIPAPPVETAPPSRPGPPPPTQVVQPGVVYKPTPQESVTWEQKLAALKQRDPVVAYVPKLAGHAPDQQLEFLQWSLHLGADKMLFSIPELAADRELSLDAKRARAVDIIHMLIDELKSEGARAPELPESFVALSVHDHASDPRPTPPMPHPPEPPRRSDPMHPFHARKRLLSLPLSPVLFALVSTMASTASAQYMAVTLSGPLQPNWPAGGCPAHGAGTDDYDNDCLSDVREDELASGFAPYFFWNEREAAIYPNLIQSGGSSALAECYQDNYGSTSIQAYNQRHFINPGVDFLFFHQVNPSNSKSQWCDKGTCRPLGPSSWASWVLDEYPGSYFVVVLSFWAGMPHQQGYYDGDPHQGDNDNWTYYLYSYDTTTWYLYAAINEYEANTGYCSGQEGFYTDTIPGDQVYEIWASSNATGGGPGPILASSNEHHTAYPGAPGGNTISCGGDSNCDDNANCFSGCVKAPYQTGCPHPSLDSALALGIYLVPQSVNVGEPCGMINGSWWGPTSTSCFGNFNDKPSVGLMSYNPNLGCQVTWRNTGHNGLNGSNVEAWTDCTGTGCIDGIGGIEIGAGGGSCAAFGKEFCGWEANDATLTNGRCTQNHTAGNPCRTANGDSCAPVSHYIQTQDGPALQLTFDGNGASPCASPMSSKLNKEYTGK